MTVEVEREHAGQEQEKPRADAPDESLRNDISDIAGLEGRHQWYLTHADPRNAGQSAESIIMSAQRVVAVHDQELRVMFHQSGPVSVAQVIGIATGAGRPEAYLDVLRDEAAQGRLFSPNAPPAAPQGPAIVDCEKIAGITDCMLLPSSRQ